MTEFVCAYQGCGKTFQLDGARLRQVRYKRRQYNTAGPYCCRGCAGKDSANKNRIQNSVGTLYGRVLRKPTG